MILMIWECYKFIQWTWNKGARQNPERRTHPVTFTFEKAGTSIKELKLIVTDFKSGEAVKLLWK